MPCDQRESTRELDYYRHRIAWRGLWAHLRHSKSWFVGLWNHILLIGHTGKNIIVEEARRHGLELRRKKCQ